MGDTAIISDAHIRIEGNPEGTVEGLYYARGKVYIEGNPVLYGSFVAAAKTVDPKYDPYIDRPESVFATGSPTVTYNGAISSKIKTPNRVQLVSMRELR
jgi:hypothetical protein